MAAAAILDFCISTSAFHFFGLAVMCSIYLQNLVKIGLIAMNWQHNM
jgi:hypothetical protein